MNRLCCTDNDARNYRLNKLKLINCNQKREVRVYEEYYGKRAHEGIYLDGPGNR